MIHIKFDKLRSNKKEDIFTLNRIYFALLIKLNSWLFPADVCLSIIYVNYVDH